MSGYLERRIRMESLIHPGKFIWFSFTVTPEFTQDLLAVHGIDLINHETIDAVYTGVTKEKQ